MFKKKPTVKPAAPIRSSDRRKLVTGIITDFNIPLPSTTSTANTAAAEPTPEEPTAGSSTNNTIDPAVTALRNALLPESTVAAKFTTTLGPQLSPVNGIIYSGVHHDSTILTDGKTRPLWVKSDEGWFPSVYTCWEAAKYEVLPVVYTHDAVMEKVYGGADLMMPGVFGVRRPGSNGGVKAGEIVGVADYQKENVVLAVGVAETDIESGGGRGGKGKAVRVLHWVGDELWGLGGSGVNPPEILDVATTTVVDVTGEGERQDGGVSLEGLNIEEEVVGESSKSAEKRVEKEESDDEPAFPDMTTNEIDSAFRDALIYSLHAILNSPERASNAHHSLNFPLPSSYVLANLIIPKLPNTQNPNYSIQKTSWKKIQKMLKQMDKEDLLKIKERGGDVFVYAVNWDSPRLTNFTPYPIVTPKPKKKPVDESVAGPSSSSSSSSSTAVKVVELYKAPAKLNTLYEATGVSSKAFYTSSQVRDTLYKYFTSPTPSDPSETLVSSTNARIITLNPLLSNLLLDDTKDARLLHSGSATRDLLAERFLRLHQQYYTIISPSGEESKPKSGQPPKITITLESRQGKKVVTRIKGLEVFGVDVGKFMDELKSVAASSVTKGPIEGGGKAAEGLVEVMVQGDKSTEVDKLLVKAGIRKADVVVDNKLKKKK
ncbi:hypothetical protein TWF788_009362 [Orbilia oligospora]|uniref:SUI1 domain-containing protein n=1 Tax=Orbilia oligospora TaxID=2813651 RepID=A0A7C8PMI9_ORBOL|nr:hypothetical protein TWF788_009362 [Orbilia oligospora]